MTVKELTCFLCRDDATILYKICDCNDSIICKDCYYIDETQDMNNCGICRKPYVFNYKRDYVEYIRLLVVYGLKYGIIIGIELFPPCYLYFKEPNELFLGFSFCCIFLVNVLNYYFIIHFSENDENGNAGEQFILLFNPVKCIYLMLIFIILQRSSKDTIDMMYIYSLIGMGLIYIFPLIIFGFIIIINTFILCNKFINEKIVTRNIIIKQIIHTNNLEEDNLTLQI